MSDRINIPESDRYPGLRPFERKDDLIFFGRSTEIRIIRDSILLNPVFTLYGRSGLGKSSLVHAGIVPALEKEGIMPVLIRFYSPQDGESTGKPAQIVLNQIAKCLFSDRRDADAAIDQYKDKNDIYQLLQSHAKGRRLLLIFDQFEEFLYHKREDRRACMNLLAGLQKSAQIGSQVRSWEIKMLFLIRADRLYLMQEVSESIPAALQYTFELLPLDIRKAEQAIELPLQVRSRDEQDRGFRTRAFQYDPEALKCIFNVLKDEAGEIESSQLQIVCQELEDLVYQRQRKIPDENFVLKKEDFKGEIGLRQIIDRFYQKQLDKLSRDKILGLSARDIRKIRHLIENDLVSGKKRIVQDETRVREKLDKVKPGRKTIDGKEKVDFLIDKLLMCRLIRVEDGTRGRIYEISHDTLLPSVIAARDQAAQNRKTWIVLGTCFGVAAIGAGILLYFLQIERSKAQYARIEYEKLHSSIQFDSVVRNTNILKTKNAEIEKLNDSLRRSYEQKRILDSLKEVKADSLSSVLNQIRKQQQNDSLNQAKKDERILALQFQSDSLKVVVKNLQKKDATLDISNMNRTKTEQIKTQAKIVQLDTKVYEMSWFKKGYFLTFGDLKVVLLDLPKSSPGIKVQVCKLSDPSCSNPVVTSTDVTTSKPATFDYGGDHYTIQLDHIGPAGNNPFTKAAYIIFRKNS